MSDYIDPSIHSGKSCTDLKSEFTAVDARYRQLWDSQKSEADSDVGWIVGGAILFFPAMLAATDGDHEDALSRIKGERQAIVSAATAKECREILALAAISR